MGDTMATQEAYVQVKDLKKLEWVEIYMMNMKKLKLFTRK